MISAASKLIKVTSVFLTSSAIMACLCLASASTSDCANAITPGREASDVRDVPSQILFQVDASVDRVQLCFFDSTSGKSADSVTVHSPDWRVHPKQIGDLENGGIYGCFLRMHCYESNEIAHSDTLYCTPSVLRHGVVITPGKGAAIADQADTSSHGETAAHNYPNPFNPREGDTRIVFEPERAGPVTMLIYDLFGHLVYEETLADASDLSWSGRNGRSEFVASGGYICVLKMGDEIVSRHKIAVVK